MLTVSGSATWKIGLAMHPEMIDRFPDASCSGSCARLGCDASDREQKVSLAKDRTSTG